MQFPFCPPSNSKHILYATDFSEASRAALPMVSAIARKYGSHVFAAHIWAPLPYSMVTPEALSVLEGKEESDAREVLEKFVRIQGIRRPAGYADPEVRRCGGQETLLGSCISIILIWLS